MKKALITVLVMCLVLSMAGCAMVDLKAGSTITSGGITFRVAENGDYCISSDMVDEFIEESPVKVDEGSRIVTDAGTLTRTGDGLEYCMSRETAEKLTNKG
jgi:hypothetical protein